jgi:serine/threonine protein kinase
MHSGFNNNKTHLPSPKPIANTNAAMAMSSYEVGHLSPKSETVKTLESYQIMKKVGKGGFATVFLVKQRTSTGRYYALKAIRKTEVVRMKQEKQIMNERAILRNVKHVFIVELFDTFQDDVNLYMVMEYVAGGDLFRHLRKMGHLSEPAARFYTGEVLVALQYIHSQKIIYRDLKPEV